MQIVLAIILGLMFGFILERVGATDPDKIVGMLRLKDLHLMKAIFSAIGLSSIILFSGVLLGFVNVEHLSIKAIYPGVLVGGALLGLGWAIGGYCPGTGIVAAGRGRKDAWFFLMGGLVGAGLFMVQYDVLKEAGLMDSWFGGKATLVDTGAKGATSLMQGSWTAAIAILIGTAMLAIGWVLPQKTPGTPGAETIIPE